MTMKKGDWFLTYTGKKFYPLDPDPDMICIRDIAHALSQVNRFGGHSREPYNVGHHSILVSSMLETDKLEGLMHDAPEAYVGDMVQPLKRFMPEFREVEKLIWRVICAKYGMKEELPPSVKYADLVLLMTEKRDLLVKHPDPWAVTEEEYPPLPGTIIPWSSDTSERIFINLFNELTGNVQV
jgi:uncharacterized protein